MHMDNMRQIPNFCARITEEFCPILFLRYLFINESARDFLNSDHVYMYNMCSIFFMSKTSDIFHANVINNYIATQRV